MAGRKVSNAAAVTVAVAVVAMLVVAASADCGENRAQVMSTCMSYCKNGSELEKCCAALKPAKAECLCNTYWDKLRNTAYESCAVDIQNRCGKSRCPGH